MLLLPTSMEPSPLRSACRPLLLPLASNVEMSVAARFPATPPVAVLADRNDPTASRNASLVPAVVPEMTAYASRSTVCPTWVTAAALDPSAARTSSVIDR